MNILEDWIKDLTEQPLERLNDRYATEEIVREEVDALPLPTQNGNTVEASQVYHAILTQLHLKIRGQVCEAALWDALLWYLAHPLPAAMAHDLIDRGIAVVARTSTRQEDEVQWRLATRHEDALYTLIRERYTEPKFSADQFEAMLNIYQYRYDDLLTMLLSSATASPDKAAIFVAAIERELDRLDELENVKLEQPGIVYFKSMLAIRPDIVEQLDGKYRRLIKNW